MSNERALRLLIFRAVNGWVLSHPQLVHLSLAKVLAGLVLASQPQRIIQEDELVSELAAQVLDFLHVTTSALGAQDSN